MAKKVETVEETKKEFPERPVRLTLMGENKDKYVQYHFQGGPAGSTRDPEEVKQLKLIQERNGTGVKPPNGRSRKKK